MLALIKYIADKDKEEKILENQQINTVFGDASTYEC